MLILTRRVGESIVINGQITVTIVEIQGGKVRLGITAPDDVPVDRQEVAEAKLASVMAVSESTVAI